MKRILVTGGAGFLGSHLCDRLIDEHEVVCMDNFFTGTRENIAQLIGHPRFELVRHDVEQPFSMEVDEIYHLACPASPVHYQRNPVRTIQTAVQGTLNALKAAHECKARFLLASTSEVYGDPEVHPQVETYRGSVSTMGPRSCYDEGKRCAEALCAAYRRQHDLDARIARIFNTYGPRLAPGDGRVISNFITQALDGQPLTVYGSGGQTRSFCYVEDLIEGLICLMNSPHETGPINLGNPLEISVLRVAELIKTMTASDSLIVFRTLPQDDPIRRRPSIERAKIALGWEPYIRLEEGIAKTILYFKGQ